MYVCVCLSVCLSIYLSIYLSMYLSMALQSFVGPWPLFQFLNPIHSRTPWTGDQPVVSRYLHTKQHKHRIKAHKYSCLEWDSKPRSQFSSGRRRFMLQIAGGHCDRPSIYIRSRINGDNDNNGNEFRKFPSEKRF
jgi:hypothetical protein